MARIPTGEELGVRRSGAASLSVAVPNIQLGEQRGLSATQKMVDEERMRVDEHELATAEVQFQLAQLHEADKYDQDEDLDTIEDRHGAAVTEQLGKAAANITNGEVRQVFMQKNGVAVEKSKLVMAAKVFDRKKDRERGYMSNAFATIVDGAKNLDYGNVQDGVVAIQLMTDSMVERGYMTNVEAQDTLRAAQHDMALGRLKAMDPERQLAALDEDWVGYLPPDVVNELRLEAERDAMDQAALYEAKALGNLDLEEGLAAITEKYADDEDMYQKTRTQFLLEKQDQAIALDEKQTGFYEDIVPAVLEGAKITDFNLDDYDLTAAQRTNLYKLEDYAASRNAGEELVRYSDDTVVRELEDMLMAGNPVAARKHLTENSRKLTIADVRFYRNALSKKVNPVEADTLLTPRMLLNQFIKENNVDAAGAKAIREEVDRKTKNYLQEKQVNPPDDLRQQWIDEEFLVIKQKNPWYWPDEEKFLYELGGEGDLQRGTVLNQLDFIQEATGMSRQSVGDLMTAYSGEYQDFVPKMDEAMSIVRAKFPDETPTQHWSRIKTALGMRSIDQPTRSIGGQMGRNN